MVMNKKRVHWLNLRQRTGCLSQNISSWERQWSCFLIKIVFFQTSWQRSNWPPSTIRKADFSSVTLRHSLWRRSNARNSLLWFVGNHDKLPPKTCGDFNGYKIWAEYLSIGNKYFHSCLNELVKNRTLALLWNDALHQFTFTLKVKHFPQIFTPNQT